MSPSATRSRRASGEGAITQRSDGRWTAALQMDGKRTWVYGRTRQEVADKLRTLQGIAQERGYLPTPGKLTLADYLHQWLEQATPRLRAKTHLDYTILTRLHVAPYVGHVHLSKLTPLHLTRLYATLQREGRSPRRVQQVHIYLHKALGDAVRWGLLDRNHAAQVDAPRRETHTPRLWTPEQAQHFIAAVQDGQGGQYGPILGFLLASGCRIGEAVGLRWSDVDWQRGAVRVERQITEVAGDPQEGPPKTRAGIRTIALPAWGVALLRRQQEQTRRWKVGSTRVFPTHDGTIPQQRNIRRAFDTLTTRLGLPRLRVHDLRHMSLSLLAMAGVPLKVAQERAGHSSPVITLRVYSHVLGDGDRQAAAALDTFTAGTGHADAGMR